MALGQGEELFREFPRHLHGPLRKIKSPLAPEDMKELCRLSHLFAEHARLRVGVLHVWVSVPFRGHQRGAKRHLEVQLLLQAFRRLRQRRH